VTKKVRLESEFIMRIAHQIRTLRVEQSLSVDDLALKGGFDPAALRRLENGEEAPTLEVIETLAAVLRVPLYRLFYDGDTPPPFPNLRPLVTMRELLRETSQRSKIGRLCEYVYGVLLGL